MIKNTIASATKFIQRPDVLHIIQPRSWLIIDDLAESMEERSQEVLQLFTVPSHHKKKFVTVILHNLFHQIKCLRTLALKSSYCIIYSDVHDSISLITLLKQIYPGEPILLLSAYSLTTNKPWGYILLNLNQNKPEDLHVVIVIFNNKIAVYPPEQ